MNRNYGNVPSYLRDEPIYIDPGRYKSAWPPVTLPVEDQGLIGSSIDRPVEPSVLDKGFSLANETKKSLANIIGRPTDLNPEGPSYVPFIVGAALIAAYWFSK